jgi:hypothetical protein
MNGPRVTDSRRTGGAVTAAMLFALVVLMLAIAVPAQAAPIKVKSGSSQMTVSAGYVTGLQAKHVTVAAVSPVTEMTKWTSTGNMYWWFRVPMKSGGTYTPSSGKGEFLHSGSLSFVEASASPHKVFRAEGIHILALSKTSYQLSVNYEVSPGVYNRVTLATSANTPKITHSGKAYKIDGVQFKLTQAGHDAINATIGESLDMTKVIFSTDILPVLN